MELKSMQGIAWEVKTQHIFINCDNFTTILYHSVSANFGDPKGASSESASTMLHMALICLVYDQINAILIDWQALAGSNTSNYV